MPFNLSSELNQNADVKIFFEGILLLVPVTKTTPPRCDVYVINHDSPVHELSVDVSVDQPQPNFPFLRLGNQIQSGLEISTTAPAGVTKYIGGSSVPNAYPFDEAINFSHLHPGVDVEPNGANPGVIKISDGVLYTATHQNDVRLERPLKDPKCIDQKTVGLILGVNIDLKGRRLQLKWGARVLDLPRTEDPKDPPGTKYIISVYNSRPVPPMQDENDFKHLYHGIRKVPEEDQYNLVFKKCSEAEGMTTSRIPCMPGVVGG